VNLAALSAELADGERDRSLAEETALAERARALDLIELVDELAVRRRDDPELADLKRRGVALRSRLVEINRRLFRELQARIRAGTLTGPRLRAELGRFTRYTSEGRGQTHFGFDGLDVLVDGLLEPVPPGSGDDLYDPDMIHYEPTPARVVLDLVDHVGLGPTDVFYDLGAGLGRVVTLVSLLAEIPTRGVELQHDLCVAARRSAQNLGAASASFTEADARSVDYSDGTVFYLFTPFRGDVLRGVLDRLREEAQRRKLTVCTYGSCTRRVVDESWLRLDDPAMRHDFKLAIFRSR
jgi:hypothetical protein